MKLFMSVLIYFLLFMPYCSLACSLIDIFTSKVGSDVNVAKNDVVFSGGRAGPILSIIEFDYDKQQGLALIQGKSDIKDYSSYSSGMCAIVGGDCKDVELGGAFVLQINNDGMRTISMPVFNGGVMVGEIRRSQSITKEKVECTKPDDSYIKKSIEIFMNTGQKQSVLDYLKSIKKVG